MMFFIALTFVFTTFSGGAPADSITLDYCYQQAYENYPKVQNIEFQKKITELNIQIANTGHYPDVSINGRASYQSEVTDFSLPGGGGPPAISKDQYQASVDVTQTIFNGGAVGIQKELEKAKGKQEIYSTEVELHQIRSQIDQVYFGILLSQQQSKTIGLLIANLEEQLSTVRSKVDNGVLLASQQHILEAELIKARQDSVNSHSNVVAGYRVLGELIGEKVATGTKLQLPQQNIDHQSLQPHRSEYDLFESTEETIEQQKRLAGSQKWPSLSAFGTAAYGRPGLNFLNDDFHEYYTVGLKVRWNFWASYNAGEKQQMLQLRQQQVEQNRRSFTRQLHASLNRIQERMRAIEENIERDKKAIALRKKIVEENVSQLNNGAITASQYVTELNRAHQARLSLYINRVRLAQAQSDYLTTLGVPIQ
ncbi:TolC family protein [Fodinibius salsisoli]|uniref:TolC family protein n=1 Tax=Fodinibius salsisoli TaxID=2820877 RepID=A0ABT3PPG3_9BACT|nr:TolC family protein [Fodinibius salsisoli]MCW9707737.1 TolC family protein [Fodinibius salsisoli]